VALRPGAPFSVGPHSPRARPPQRADGGHVSTSHGNPLGVEALRGFFEGPFFALLPLLALCVLACAWSVIRRFRRSRGLKRLQMKWLATGAGVVTALYAAAIVVSLLTGQASSSAPQPTWLTVLDQVALYSFVLIPAVLIPAAVGAAILRHRLYDIDVLINRALVYGALTAVLALVYVAGVVGVGGALRALRGRRATASPLRRRPSRSPPCSAPLGRASRPS